MVIYKYMETKIDIKESLLENKNENENKICVWDCNICEAKKYILLILFGIIAFSFICYMLFVYVPNKK